MGSDDKPTVGVVVPDPKSEGEPLEPQGFVRVRDVERALNGSFVDDFKHVAAHWEREAKSLNAEVATLKAENATLRAELHEARADKVAWMSDAEAQRLRANRAEDERDRLRKLLFLCTAAYEEALGDLGDIEEEEAQDLIAECLAASEPSKEEAK